MCVFLKIHRSCSFPGARGICLCVREGTGAKLSVCVRERESEQQPSVVDGPVNRTLVVQIKRSFFVLFVSLTSPRPVLVRERV